MNKALKVPIRIAISSLFITAGCATNALAGVSLIAIPLAATATTNDARAITPDGLWVVGVGDAVGDSDNPTHGFLYNVTSGNVYNVIDTFGDQSTIAAGVCYRTSNGEQQVIVGGMAWGWNATYCFTNGTAFAQARLDATYGCGGDCGEHPAIGLANQRASGGGDVYWDGFGDTAFAWQRMWVGRVSGAWGSPTVANDEAPTGSQVFAVYGVSGTGRAVGYIKSSGYHNFLADWNGSGSTTVTYFNGLNGSDAGFAYAITADGFTVFGNSPTPTDGQHYHGYKLVDPLGTPTINQLPDFPDTSGSTYTLSVPYGCTSDGQYAVGQNYRSGAVKAVVWDTSNSDPTKWTVMDLTELAKFEGVLGIFTGNLRWAYSVGTNANGLVIAGTGVNTSGASRAFLMTIPLPSAPALTISKSGGDYTLQFLGFGNTTTVLEYTTDLNTHIWNTLVTDATGNVVTYHDVGPTDAQRFYRARTQ